MVSDPDANSLTILSGDGSVDPVIADTGTGTFSPARYFDAGRAPSDVATGDTVDMKDLLVSSSAGLTSASPTASLDPASGIPN